MRDIVCIGFNVDLWFEGRCFTPKVVDVFFDNGLRLFLTMS